MRKLVKSLLITAALAGGSFPGAAQASLTRIAGPTHLVTDARLADMFDVTFDSVNQVYLVVWGTMNFGPTNGMFLNSAGVPIGSAFAISAGSYQAGWARVTAGGGKFLVAYTKILGPGSHRRAARFVTYQGGAPALSSEIEIDTWSGGAGSASGVGFSNGRFLVTWWNWQQDPPQTYVTVLDANGGYLAYKVQITSPDDARTDPEIACDPARNRCLVVGNQWGMTNPGWTPGTWAQLISDETGARIGGNFSAGYGVLQKESTVAYSAAGDRYVVTFSRGQNTVYTARLSGASGAVIDEYLLLSEAQQPGGVCYGLPQVTYNAATQTLMVAAMPCIALTAVIELDTAGSPIPGTFQFIPGTSDWLKGTKEVAAAADPVNSRFLAADIQDFQHFRSTAFSAVPAAGGGETAPPPPAGPAVSDFALKERARADFSGDGKYDLLWQDLAGGYLAGWTLDGTTLLTSDLVIETNGTPSRIADTNWRIVGSSDMNGDGKPDLVLQHQVTGYVGVWFMNGLTNTAGAYFSVARVEDANWKIVGVGDMNGDGKPDLVWQHMTDGWLAAWLLDGLQVLASELLTPKKIYDVRWQIAAVADMTGDGKTDLIWRHSTSGDMGYWAMDGLTFTDSEGFTNIAPDPANWKIAAIIDVNGDDKPDIIWHHIGVGAVIAWFMDGKTYLGWSPVGNGPVPTTWRVVGPR